MYYQIRTLVHICTYPNWQRGILGSELSSNMYRRVHQFWPFLRITRPRNVYTHILKHIDNRRLLLFLSRLVLIWLQRMQNVIVCLYKNFLQIISMGVIRGQKLLYRWIKGENCIFSSVSVDTFFHMNFLATFSTILKSASNIASVDT